MIIASPMPMPTAAMPWPKHKRADAPAETHGNDRQDMIDARLLQRLRPGFNEQHRENERRDQGREAEAGNQHVLGMETPADPQRQRYNGTENC